MNFSQIYNLENDPAIIAKYVKAASFGKNRLVYVPIIIGLSALMAIVLFYVTGVATVVGLPVIIFLAAAGIICLVLALYINKKAHEKLSTQVHTAPISIAKKIYGNDNAKVHYAIYTEGKHRHDEAFIDRIADKIFAIHQQPRDIVERQVANLFRPDFVNYGEFAKQLPLAFTDGVTVWRRQFFFGAYTPQVQQQINDNDNKFPVVIISPENAKFLIEAYR